MFRQTLWLSALVLYASPISAQQNAELSEKASLVAEKAGFNSGFIPMLNLAIQKTDTNAIVMTECVARGPQLKKQAVELATNDHFESWKSIVSVQLLNAYGDDFVSKLDSSDPKTLTDALRKNPNFEAFLGSLDRELRPLLAEATTTSLEFMYSECFE